MRAAVFRRNGECHPDHLPRLSNVISSLIHRGAAIDVEIGKHLSPAKSCCRNGRSRKDKNENEHEDPRNASDPKPNRPERHISCGNNREERQREEGEPRERYPGRVDHVVCNKVDNGNEERPKQGPPCGKRTHFTYEAKYEPEEDEKNRRPREEPEETHSEYRGGDHADTVIEIRVPEGRQVDALRLMQSPLADERIGTRAENKRRGRIE